MRLRIAAALVVAASSSLAAGQTSEPLGVRDARGREATPAPTLGKRASGELGGGVVHQPRGVVPNDACAGAITLAVPSTTQVSTEGAESDAAPSCAGASLSGPGVWYGVVGTGRMITISTCAAFSFDTQLSVYCGSCAGLTCVIANDDACSGGGSSVSFCSEAGRGYLILVHGYAGASGTCTLVVTQGTTSCGTAPACGTCTIEIPQDAVGEGEQACGPGYVDGFNGGCNSSPARFSQISIGQAISGRAGTYVREGLEYRDTDWYEFTLASAARITWAGAAEFPFRLGLIDGNSGCRAEEVFDYGTAAATGCQGVTVSAVLPAGRYIAWAGPSVLTGVPCGSRYFARLTATPAGACTLHGTAGCALLTPEECASLGGDYQGDGTGCQDVNYFVSATTSAFESIAATGTVAAVGEDAGVVAPIGFTFGFFNELRTQVGISPNGYLSFGGALDDASNGSIPDPASPNGLVAPRWDNLAPAPGSVRYETRGSAPTRRFIVQWTSVPQFGLSVPSTFQAVLFEADGSMEFRYQEMAPGRFAGDFTTGVEDGRGVRGVGVPMAQVVPNSALAFRKGNLVAPVAVAGGPYVLRAADASVIASARGSYDPDGASPGFGGIASVQWDLGGDGTTDDAGRTNADEALPLTACITYGLALDHPVVLRLAVTDADGLSAVDSTEVRFSSTAPTADAGGTYPPIGPGDCLQVHGVVTDPDLAVGVGEVVTAEWDSRPAMSAAEVGDGFALGADACIPYGTLASIAAGGSDTIYLNVRDRAGGVASSAARFALLRPDLRCVLSAGPSSVVEGSAARVAWRVENIGTGRAGGAWNDRVFLSSLPDGGGTVVSLGELPRLTELAAGSEYVRDQAIVFPIGSVGTWYLHVLADSGNSVDEGGRESNNRSTLAGSVMVTQAPRPDLTPTPVVAPASAAFGTAITVAWGAANAGNTAASGAWADRLYLSHDTLLSGDDAALGPPIQRPNANSPLAPGAAYTRSAGVTLPTAFEAGQYYVLVRVDDGNVLAEADENNNVRASGAIAISATPAADLSPVANGMTVPASGVYGQAMSVTWSGTNGGVIPASGVWGDRVYLSVDTALSADDEVLGVFPTPTTPLPVGAAYSSTAPVTPRLQAGSVPGPMYVLVALDAFNAVAESNEANNVAVGGPVQMALPPLPDLSVASVGTPPPSAPGESVEVSWTVRNDGAAATYAAWTERISVSADDIVGGDVTVAEMVVDLPLGPGEQVTRTRQIPLVDLGRNYRVVVCVDVNNRNVEANEGNNCGISAEGVVRRPDLSVVGVAAPLTGVADGVISVAWSVANVGDAPANGLWLDRVYLSSDGTWDQTDTLLASIPHTGPLDPVHTYEHAENVRIPGTFRGEYSVFVVADSTDSLLESGPAVNNIGRAVNRIAITQPDRADLRVTRVSDVTDGLIGDSVQLSWTVRNDGPAPASGSWVDRVLLVPDWAPEEPLQVGLAIRPRELAPGETYEQSATFLYPPPAGRYRVAVVTDSAQTVFEGLDGGESNNWTEAPRAVEIGTYVVSVSTPFTSGVPGKAVPLSGSAMREGTGAPVGNADIGVAVMVRDTRRVINARTDQLGRYTCSFTPVPTEGGRYTLAAGPALAVGDVVQDSFSLYAMTVQPVESRVVVHPGKGEGVCGFTLRNSGDVTLGGLEAQVVGDTDGLQVLTELGGGALTALESRAVTVRITAQSEQTGTRELEVVFSSAQGAVARARLTVEVRPGPAALRAEPGELRSAMLRSTASEVRQTHVQFDVRNFGGTATGPLEVLASPAPWLAITSPVSLAPLGPGESAPVVLTLTPAADLALGEYRGQVVVRGAGGLQPSVVVGFTFTCVSDGVGSLAVSVEDEFTYFAEGSPRVERATVTISDPATGAVLGTGVSGADGRVVLPDLPEAMYNLEVRAPGHQTDRRLVQVLNAQVRELPVFVPRQLVTYTWQVVPTEIPDRYEFTLRLHFETEVPAPVVSVEPAYVNLAEMTAPVTQVNFTIRNSGRVRADNVRFTWQGNAAWQVTPLIEDLGDMGPMSEVVVPVVFQRLRGSGDACGVSGDLCSEYFCGEQRRQCIDLTGTDPGQCGGGGGGGGGGGVSNGPASGPPGPGDVEPPPQETTGRCEECDTRASCTVCDRAGHDFPVSFITKVNGTPDPIDDDIVIVDPRVQVPSTLGITMTGSSLPSGITARVMLGTEGSGSVRFDPPEVVLSPNVEREVMVYGLAASSSKDDTRIVLRVRPGGPPCAEERVTVVEELEAIFAGSFQYRLATDTACWCLNLSADPYEGWTFTFDGEPDFDRVLRVDAPGFLRTGCPSFRPTAVASVVSARPAAVFTGDAIVGHGIRLGSQTWFAGRNTPCACPHEPVRGVGALHPPPEPIQEFEMSVFSSSGEALRTSMDPSDRESSGLRSEPHGDLQFGGATFDEASRAASLEAIYLGMDSAQRASSVGVATMRRLLVMGRSFNAASNIFEDRPVSDVAYPRRIEVGVFSRGIATYQAVIPAGRTATDMMTQSRFLKYLAALHAHGTDTYLEMQFSGYDGDCMMGTVTGKLKSHTH